MYLRSVTTEPFLNIVDYNRWMRLAVYLPTKLMSLFTSNHQVISYTLALTFLIPNILFFFYGAKKIKNNTLFLFFFLSTQISFFYQRLISLKGLAVLGIWFYLFTSSKKLRSILAIVFSVTHIYFIGFVALWKLFEFKTKKIRDLDRYDLIEFLAIAIGGLNFFILNPAIVDEATRGIEIIQGTEYAHFYFISILAIFSLVLPNRMLRKSTVLYLLILAPLTFITFFIHKFGYTFHCWYRTYKVIYFIISLHYIALYIRLEKSDIKLRFSALLVSISAVVIFSSVILNSYIHHKAWSKVIRQVERTQKSCWSPKELNMIHSIQQNPFWGCYEMSSDTFTQFLIETNQNVVQSVLNIKYESLDCDELEKGQRYDELMFHYGPEYFMNDSFDIKHLYGK